MPERRDSLEVRTRREGESLVVHLAGEVDLRTSPELRQRLLESLESRPPRVIVDLRGVSYIDSSGVGTLVEMKRRADGNGASVVLVGLQPRVRSVFEITRLDTFFHIVETLEEAQRA